MTVSGLHHKAEILSLPYAFDPLGLHRLAPQRYPFLLQSVARHPSHGCYDILFAFPETTITARQPGDGFLHQLDEAWSSAALPPEASVGPFSGGWFLCLAYELAGEIEPSLRLAAWEGGFTAFATRIPVALIRDHRSQRAWGIAEPGYAARLADLERDLNSSLTAGAATRACTAPRLNEPEDALYIDAVRAAQQYIRAGDIFQANLSREWRAVGEATDMTGLYHQLRMSNPAPFAGLVRFNDVGLASSSPERLIGIRNGRVFTRPIAGTRPRAPTSATDSRLSRSCLPAAKNGQNT